MIRNIQATCGPNEKDIFHKELVICLLKLHLGKKQSQNLQSL